MKKLLSLLIILATITTFAEDLPKYPSDSVDLRDVVVDENGVAYILDKLTMMVFRYDSKSSAYLSPVSLENNVNAMAYSPNHKRLYLAGEDGRVIYLDPNNFLKEHFFTDSKAPVGHIVAVDKYLYLVPKHHTRSGALLFDKHGSVSTDEWAYEGTGYQTDGNAVYFTSVGISPADVYKHKITKGRLERTVDTPYHGDSPFERMKNGYYRMAYPVAANGESLVLSDGHILNVNLMKDTGRLPTHDIMSALFTTKDDLFIVTNEKNLTLRHFDFWAEKQNFLIPGKEAAVTGEGANAILVYKDKTGIRIEKLSDILSGKVVL
jgi:hypothetical protein